MNRTAKIVICLLLVFVMLPAAVLVASAVPIQVTGSKLIDNCETAWSGTEVDTSVKTQGSGSISKTFNISDIEPNSSGNSLVLISRRFDTPIDVSAYNTFSFDFYVSSPEFVNYITSGQIEVTSSGTCDQQEMNWILPQTFSSLKTGWNRLTLPLEKSDFNAKAFNFIRLYMWFDHDKAPNKNFTYKIDNICFQKVTIDYEVLLSSMNSADQVNCTKKFTIDEIGTFIGDGSVRFQIDPANDSRVITEVGFNSVDIDGCGMLKIYLYISNEDFVKEWTQHMSASLGSDETGMKDYYAWDFDEVLLYPLTVGWNLIQLPFKFATSIGTPNMKQICYFRLTIDGIQSENPSKTTIRIDDIMTDEFSMHIGAGTLENTISRGREYDDDDYVPSETETDPFELETHDGPGENETTDVPGNETESGKSPEDETGQGSSEGETLGGGTMLDDADEELNKNTYTTDHSKVVASLVASALFAATSAAVAVLVVLKIRKNG